ncbi:uncharacterized protein METZ01_LOCUS471216, partial [marine metagenome]
AGRRGTAAGERGVRSRPRTHQGWSAPREKWRRLSVLYPSRI